MNTKPVIVKSEEWKDVRIYYDSESNTIKIDESMPYLLANIHLEHAADIANAIHETIKRIPAIVDGKATRRIEKGEAIWLPTEEYEKIQAEDEAKSNPTKEHKFGIAVVNSGNETVTLSLDDYNHLVAKSKGVNFSEIRRNHD